MFVRFEGSIAGHNFAYAPGDICEWPDGPEINRAIERGLVSEIPASEVQEAVKNGGKPLRRHRNLETMTRSTGEKAVTR